MRRVQVVGDEPEDPVRPHGQRQQAEQGGAADADEDGVLGAEVVVDPAAEESAEHREDAELDAVDQHRNWPPVECGRRIDAAEHQQRRHPVVEEQPRQQIGADIAVMPQALIVAITLSTPCIIAVISGQVGRGLVGREEKQRQAEDRQPYRANRSRQPLRLMQCLADAEQRMGRNEIPRHIAGQREANQHEQQQDDAGRVAERKPEP